MNSEVPSHEIPALPEAEERREILTAKHNTAHRAVQEIWAKLILLGKRGKYEFKRLPSGLKKKPKNHHLLQGRGVSASVKKSLFFKKSVSFLWFIATRNAATRNPEKSES